MSATDVPENLLYSAEHEWVELAEGVAKVGITAHAAEALGDVVFVALPAAGDAVSTGDVTGEVESHKSVSEIFAPVGGEILEVNERLEAEPELAGTDPYGEGWLYTVRFESATEHLLTPAAYRELLAASS